MASAINLFVAYKFITQLSTPWKNWDAYKMGLIDANGKKLRKTETDEEKKKYPIWKRLVANLKRMVQVVPGGKTKIGSFAASLFLLKEEMECDDIKVMEEEFMKFLEKSPILLENESIEEKINTIECGRYRLESGKVLFINETESFTEVLGTPLFKVIDKISKESFIVSHNELTKF